MQRNIIKLYSIKNYTHEIKSSEQRNMIPECWCVRMARSAADPPTAGSAPWNTKTFFLKSSCRGVELGPNRDIKKMLGLYRASREHTKVTERKWWRPPYMNQRWYTARGINHNWRPTPPKRFYLDHRRTRYKYTQVPSNTLSSAMDLNFDTFFLTISSQGEKLSIYRRKVNCC